MIALLCGTVAHAQAPSISGSVFDATTFQPLANVLVYYEGDDGSTGSASTAADGTYSIESLTVGVSYTISAFQNGYSAGPPSITHTVATPTDVVTGANFVMSPQSSAEFRGRVFADDGIGGPPGPASVGVADVLIRLTNGLGINQWTLTDADGRFVFPGLSVGEQYTATPLPTALIASPASISHTMVTSVEVFTGGVFELFDSNSAEVGGMVVLADGNVPFGGVRVTLTNAQGATSSIQMTSSDGQFYFVGLAAGTYTISLQGNEALFQGRIVDPGTLMIALDYGQIVPQAVVFSVIDPATASIRGRVTQGWSGAPVAGRLIKLKTIYGEVRYAFTDASGQYDFVGLIGGLYEIDIGDTSPFSVFPASLRNVSLATGNQVTNADFTFNDSVPPTGLAISSTSHAVSAWSADTTIDLAFSASDPASGIRDYSLWFDQSAVVGSSSIFLGPGPGTTATATADGDWYAHVSVCDLANNCTVLADSGPYRIDTTPPAAPGDFFTEPHSVGVPNQNSQISVNWRTPLPDAGSPIASYRYQVGQLAAAQPCSVLPQSTLASAPAGMNNITSSVLDGASYVHVCAVDGAGNFGPVATLGPLVIDTTPPNGLVVTSTSHTPGVWQIDNTVDFAFAGAVDASYYYVAFDQSPYTVPNASSTQTSALFTGTAPVNGDTWYIHVRACDALFNCAAVVHQGPYFIGDPLTSQISGQLVYGQGSGVAASGQTVWATNTQSGATLFQVTDSQGDFRFSGLAAGDYAVSLPNPPPGLILTPDAYQVTVQPDSVVDLGTWRLLDPATGSISGRVTDEAANGFEGLTVFLKDNAGSATLSARATDANGAFEFGSLLRGGYTIEVRKAGLTPDPLTVHVDLDYSESNNLGNLVLADPLTGTITGRTLSGQIVPDTPIPGVVVLLTHVATGLQIGTISNATGDYAFNALAGGAYTLDVFKQGYAAANPGIAVNFGPGGANEVLLRLLDATAPNGLQIAPISHVPLTWSNLADVSVQMSAEDMSGVAGYAVVADGIPATIPGTSYDTQGGGFTASFADGDHWYIHARAGDPWSNFGPAVHSGPYWIDTTPPSAPGAIGSSSHASGVPTSNATITVSWIAATDATSGVAFYRYGFDGSSAAPACTSLGATSPSPNAVSTPLADGSRYVHVCAVDLAGNTGPVLTAGPYLIDTVAPDGLIVDSTSHAVSSWSNDGSVNFQFSGASSVSGYSAVFDRSSTTDPGTSGAVPGAMFTGLASIDGNDWYVHVRACDAAGNCGPVVHRGPYWIDTVVPSDPGAIISSSHTPGVFSGNPTISISWPAATDSGSGVLGYRVAFDESPSATCASMSAGLGVHTVPYSGSWYAHVCAADVAGNLSAVVNAGPYEVRTTGNLSINVLACIDAPTCTPLEGQIVDLSSSTGPGTISSWQTTTDSLGRADFQNVPVAVYTVQVVKPGFRDETVVFELLPGVPGQLNVNLMDDTAPSTPFVFSTDHISSVWSSNATLNFAFVGASDAGSGMAGYSVVFDRIADTSPDTTVEQASIAYSAIATADGNDWYVHVRACDRWGNCAAAAHSGPYWIDANAPSAPGLISSSSHSPGADTSDASVDVSWLAATDAGSGVSGYRYRFDSEATAANCANALSTTSLAATSSNLADGIWYVHVCAIDAVGNEGPVSSGGPYRIDTVAPTGLIVSSMLVPESTWSRNTEIDFTFSGVVDAIGYAVAFDQLPATDPGSAVSQVVTTFTGSAVPEGNHWYVHVRACDAAGNCGVPVHRGPYWIDATPPALPDAITSGSHGSGSPVANATISIAWPAASDATSGLASYRYAFNGSPSAPACVSLDSSTSATSADSGVLADGTWYAHVCVTDVAGNESPVRTSAPFLIDTIAPGGLSISSPSHPESTWSNDASIDFSFDGVTDANGVEGYAIVFDQLAATDPGSTVVQPGTAFTGSAVPDGIGWHVHVRACDAAGNCSAPVHRGPHWIDTIGPTVEGVDTIAPTGSGLTENEIAIVAITALTLHFDGEMLNADGASRFELVAANANGSLETATCGNVSATDLAISIDAASYDPATRTTTLAVNSGAALADDQYRLLACADLQDLAGNALAGGTFARTFSIDRRAPQVTMLSTVADTGDGSLDEGEPTSVAISELLLSFDEVLSDPPGDAETGDVTNPASYLLIEDGGDGFQTVDCATGVDPADNAITISAVVYEPGTSIASLILASALADGHYRLSGCASDALRDLGGNALDGDGNGAGGDDFVRTFQVDTLAPATLPTISMDALHGPGSWSNVGEATAYWSGAADDVAGSGLSGYSVVFDTSPASVPDTSEEVAHASDAHSQTATLGEGLWFVHVRPCDRAGNCSQGASHLSGSFGIDQTAPSAPGAISSGSHGSGNPIANAVIDVAWLAANDRASGIAGYQYGFDSSGNTPECASLSSTTTAEMTSSPVLGVGEWYVHVCAVDAAGNTGDVASAGPYVVGIPGIRMAPNSGMQTTESGGTAMVSVTLSSEPTASVRVIFSSTDPSEGVVGSPLLFNTGNWNLPQVLGITGIDDSDDDGDVAYEVEVTVSSSDTSYQSLAVPSLMLTNLDDDLATTTVDLQSSLNPADVGLAVTLTAAVSGVTPTGTVSFRSGGIEIMGCDSQVVAGTGATRTASCTTTELPAVSQFLTAVYSGDSNNDAATSPALSQLINGFDLSITISRVAPGIASSPDAIAGGAPLASYRIEIINAGPTAINVLDLQATVSAGLFDIVWVCTPPSGSCSAATSEPGSLLASFMMPVDQSAIIEVSGQINTSVPFVEITAQASTPDGDPLRQSTASLIEATRVDRIFTDGFD